MDSDPPDASAVEPASDLTLHDAAAVYAVSARTLAQHIRRGQLPAYKTAGATGREWRVTQDALVAAGYRRRQPPGATDAPEPPLVVQLRRELEAARRAAVAERHRAEDTDRRLGHALLECGRLRSALAAATGAGDESKQLDLTSTEARWVVKAVRHGSSEQGLAQERG